jgi:two-component system chemotaxis response regulator CheY
MATILIAEDNPVNQRMLTFILKKEGHTVITAVHGVEALDRLAETTIDVVITDIGMPEMDGITLLKHMRADASYQELPVIVITASGEDVDYATARKAGANDLLTKPVSSRQLIDTVSRVLAQQ